MGEYCRGTRKDMQEMLDFANMVFSMSSGSTDFERLLPKAYAPDKNMTAAHHMIKEDGRIRACIDVLPIVLSTGEETLKAGYVGTVGVHPKARGKRYMITLMEQAEAQQREEGADIMILDGNRHRYQHYGFERAGMKYCFQITADSIRHCCRALSEELAKEKKEYRFELIEAENRELMDKSFALYRQRAVTAREKESFAISLSSWEADLYAVFSGEAYRGYLSVSADERNILEFALEDGKELPYVIQSFMEETGSEELGMQAGMDEPDKIEELNLMADYYTVNMSHMIKILNYERALRFLLLWKKAMYRGSGALEEGSVVLGVIFEEKKEQQNYCMEYSKGSVTVTKTKKEAQLVLEEKELVRTLTTSYYFHELQKPESPLQRMPKGWFPLPFFLPEADAF